MSDKCLLPTPDFSDDGVYHIYSMRFGRVAERRIHDNFMRRDMHDGPMPLDFNVWILHNAHRTVLVDTGFGPRAAGERRRGGVRCGAWRGDGGDGPRRRPRPAAGLAPQFAMAAAFSSTTL